jgi:hypothetical protein
MSEIKVNSIKGVGASVAALSINNTDGTCTANLTNRTNKNLILNGAFLISQRGTSSTSSGYQTVDRFKSIESGTDESPTYAQADVASGTTPYTLGFRKALRVTNGNQTSGAGGGDYIWIQTPLEAQDIANSGWNYTSSSSYVTLSFWVKSSVAQDFKGYLRSSDGTNKAYAIATGSLSADTWTKITKTIPGHSDLQFDNDNGPGLEINFLPFLGTDRTDGSVTENAWVTYSSSARTKDNTSTWYTTNDATFEITGVQLEVSDHATDFEHRSFGQELELCKRYYQPLSPRYTAGQYLITNEVAASTVFFNPEMRATPTATHETLSCRENSDSFVDVSVSSNYNLTSKGINYVVTKTGAATSDSFIIFVNNAEGNTPEAAD